jgi:hypothetical protein
LGLALTVVAAGASGQTGQNFGEIVGKAVDQQGAVLPGVTVALSGPAVMGTQAAVTNEHGMYRYPAVPPGSYKLTFTLAGFATVVRDGVNVPVRVTVTIDAEMKVASMAETVTVTGETPVVDVENAKVGQRLDKEILNEIPTQRTIFGSTTVLPGMVMGRQDVGGLYSGTSTGMVAHGSTQYNLNFFGVSTDTPQDYGSMYYVDYGSAQEISVDTAAMGADIGGPGGANINVVPKSGSNRFAGSLFYTTTGTGLGMGLVGDNVDDALRNQGIAQGTRVKKLLDVNADIGGPIKTDAIWFYLSVRRYDTKEQIINYKKDFETGLSNYLLNTTFRLSTNNSLSVFWTFNRKSQPNRGAAANVPPESTWKQLSDKNLENVNWRNVLGQNTFTEVSASMFRMYWPTWYSDEWYALPKPIPPSYDTTTGNYWGAQFSGERFRDSRRLQVNGGVTHYVDQWLGANHQMRVGFENWYGWGSDGLDVYNDTAYRYRNGAPYEIRVFNTPLSQRTHMKNISIFGQDRMTFGRFTLSLGLRYASYDGFLPEQTGGGGEWPALFPRTTYPRIDPGFTWRTWAPRTGFIYKLTADGRNVMKVSYNRYFNHMYTWHFSDVINPNVLRTSGMNVYTWSGDANGNGRVDPGEYNPKAKSVFKPKNNSIDPSFNAPKNDEIVLGYQRDLSHNIGLTVSWIQRWFTDSWADVNQFPDGAYDPRAFTDPGPDQVLGTGDDKSITVYALKPQYVGTEAYVRQNVPGTVTYKGLELSINKRMANRWQLQMSYVWSRLTGPVWSDSGGREAYDPNNPNLQTNIDGRGVYDQPHAFKVIGSYMAPWDISLGINYQALSGYPYNRQISASLPQGGTTIRLDPLGTYRTDFFNLLSVRANKRFTLPGRVRVSAFVEFHNLLNSSAAQSKFETNQAFASAGAFDYTTSYFGKTSEIIAPRVIKLGAKIEF